MKKLTGKEARSGYTKYFGFNPNWKKQKALCGYEHCIELMYIGAKRTKKSCPLFGHNCPGGKAMVDKCRKTLEDVPEERFAKI